MGRPPHARARYLDAPHRPQGGPEVALAYARYLMTTGHKKEAEQVADDLPPVDLRELDSVVKRVELLRVTKQFPQARALVESAAQGDPPEEIKVRLPLLRGQVLA